MLKYAVDVRNHREKELNAKTRRGCVYFHMLNISKILISYKMIMENLHLGQVVNLNTPQNHAMMDRIDRLCTDGERLQNTINEMTQAV